MLSTLSMSELSDYIKRDYEADTAKREPHAMIKSGMVRREKVAPNTQGVIKIKQRLVSSQYARTSAESENFKQADNQTGWDKDLFIKQYNLQQKISKVARLTGNNQTIQDSIESLKNSTREREELDLSHRISFATVSSYVDMDGTTRDVTTGDGLPLASTAKGLTGSATTYRTILAGNPVFSLSALEQMEDLLGRGRYDNLGQVIHVSPNVLWTVNDPAQINEIRRVLNSTTTVGQQNSSVINPFQDKYTLVIITRGDTNAQGGHDATKAKYWGLCDTKCSSFHEKVFEDHNIVMPTEGSNGEDVSNLDWTYTSTFYAGIAIASAEGFCLSKGDGSP